ncbi:hypothetical protein ABPG75_000135 [Micractinium tetrahymenae]
MKVALQDYPHLLEQLNGKELASVPPGEVHFTWLHPPRNSPAGDAILPKPLRQAVEEAARAVAAAAVQEVQHTGFGTHILERGWNVVVLPTKSLVGQMRHSAGDVIVLSTGLVEACLQHSSKPAAALMFAIAHEMGHCVARHGYEVLPVVLTLRGAFDKRSLKWQHELEADEFAAAVLLRAKVLPEEIGEFLQAAGSRRVERNKADRPSLMGNAFKLDVASGSKMQGASELRHLRQALKSGSADQLYSLAARWEALQGRQKAAAEVARAADSSSAAGAGTIRVGNSTVPAQAVAALPIGEAVAMLRALASTHPPYEARLARLRQLATRPDMLLRIAAPALHLAPGSWAGSGLNPAEHVAELVAAAQSADKVVTAGKPLAAAQA